MPDDYSADIHTDGSVAVGGSAATGEIETAKDFDWFAVELVAGRTYVIDVEGDDTGAGTLRNTVLRGLYDAHGDLIADTRDHDGGIGKNAQLTFTATETETHYIEARGKRFQTGTYTVEVTDETPDLGDITELAASESQSLALDGAADAVAYRRFTLSAEKVVELELLGLDADADLVLEDTGGNELHASRSSGTTGETLTATLAAGTYYVRVEARESGANAFELRYEVSEVDVAPPSTITHISEQVEPPVPAQQGMTEGVSEPSGTDLPADTTTAGVVTVGGSVRGRIGTANDRDWFAVTLEAGTTYRIDLKRPQDAFDRMYDPYLRGVYDADGDFIPSTTDDDSGWGLLNSRVIFEATADGTYYVAAGGYGTSKGRYKLSVRETEVADDYAARTDTAGMVAVGGSSAGEIDYKGDHDWFAVTLEAGKTYRIDLKRPQDAFDLMYDPYLRGVYDADGDFIAGTTDNDSGAGLDSRVFFEATADGTYYVAAGGYGTSKGRYKLSVTEVADDYTARTDTAGMVAVGGSSAGEIDYEGDRDWFAVTLEAGKAYRIDLKGTPTESGTLGDPYLRGVYDDDGKRISGTSDHTHDHASQSGDGNSGAGNNSRVYFAATRDATYYVAAGADGDEKGTYTLSVEEITDDDYAAWTNTTGTVEVGGSSTGKIDYPRDRDWFAVELEDGKTYRIDQEGWPTRSGTLWDSYLRGVYDANGDLISGTTDDDGGVGNSRVEFTATDDATYYVAASGSAVHMGTYTLLVEEVM